MALVNVIIHAAENDRPYGILQVDSRQPRDFAPPDTEFLRAYANLPRPATVVRLREAAEIRTLSRAAEANAARLRTPDRHASPARLERRGRGSAHLGQRAVDRLHRPHARGQSRPAAGSQPSTPTTTTRPAPPGPTPNATAASISTPALRHAPTGDARWFQMRATPVRDAAGTLIEWIGTSTDIDEQVRAPRVVVPQQQRARGARRGAHRRASRRAGRPARRDRGAQPQRRAAPPEREAQGRGPAHRRHRARLQQPAAEHHRQHRPDPPPGRPRHRTAARPHPLPRHRRPRRPPVRRP